MHRGDEKALVVLGDDQTLRCDLKQRLPQRADADLVALAELFELQPLAGREVMADDVEPQLLRDPARQRPRLLVPRRM